MSIWGKWDLGFWLPHPPPTPSRSLSWRRRVHVVRCACHRYLAGCRRFAPSGFGMGSLGGFSFRQLGKRLPRGRRTGVRYRGGEGGGGRGGLRPCPSGLHSHFVQPAILKGELATPQRIQSQPVIHCNTPQRFNRSTRASGVLVVSFKSLPEVQAFYYYNLPKKA